MELEDWTDMYIDYLNAFQTEPISKLKKDNVIECTYPAKTLTYVYSKHLGPAMNREKGYCVLITRNTKENVLELAKHWHDFAKNPGLKILFVNPKVNMKWFINPHLHEKVADMKSLKKGLLSLHEGVPEAEE